MQQHTTARYAGVVIHGNGRGKTLGFPTANLELAVPAPLDGVYSAWARVGSGSWRGATISVGDNPTFKNVGSRRVECHIHDLRDDLYGQSVEIELVAFLRAMIAFADAQELIDHTKADVVRSRNILSRAALPAEQHQLKARA
ncbi:MAG: riboflavin kinase [Leucobacter sp.]